MRVCIDCSGELKNRSKSTKRCRSCYQALMSKNKKGRSLPICSECGKTLSTKKNQTGKCKSCSLKNHAPWNKGLKGLVPWNKGTSKFSSNEEYRLHVNGLRREKRKEENRQTVIADRIRTLIRNQIKTVCVRKTGTKTEKYLGCDPNYYRKYLEGLWEKGMNWDNYGNGKGKWNIDHIIPTTAFDLTKESERKTCFHYLNTQPMWSIENIKKGRKLAAAVLTTVVTW